MSRLFLFLKGIAMGAADVVPGVSGGTIAFITGIYEELLSSIGNVNAEAVRKLFKEGIVSFWKHVNGNFLLVLFSGIGVSLVSLAKLVTYLLENHPTLLWSFFFGLIVASVWLIGKTVGKWNLFNIIGLIAGTITAYFITVISPAETTEAYWFTFLSGAVAICAMILPGISGSFILLLMGKYKYIFESISSFKIDVIVVFALGCLTGLLSFAKGLSWMFKNYRNLTISILTGFMIGSLNKVWPWKVTLESTVDRHGETIPVVQESVLPGDFAGDPQLWPAIACALAGLVLIIVLERASANKPQS